MDQREGSPDRKLAERSEPGAVGGESDIKLTRKQFNIGVVGTSCLPLEFAQSSIKILIDNLDILGL